MMYTDIGFKLSFERVFTVVGKTSLLLNVKVFISLSFIQIKCTNLTTLVLIIIYQLSKAITIIIIILQDKNNNNDDNNFFLL